MNPQLLGTAASVLALVARNIELYSRDELTDEEFEHRLKSVQSRFADLRGVFEVDETREG